MTQSFTSALNCRDVTVRYGDVVALSNVTVGFVPGLIHAVVGQNGAGKTTFARVASGLVRPAEGMVEILLLSLLIGGLASLMEAAGGLAWLSQAIARFARGHRGRRTGEFSIAALSAAADTFTANNTVAILVGGSVARDIALRHGISPRRAASVLDIFACIVQGVLPYGAQILLAASLAAVSPLALAASVQYCWLLAVSALVFMLWPSRRPVQATE